MSAKIIPLMPHFFNYRLHYLNRQAWRQSVLTYGIPNEYECKPPDDLVDIQAKYEPQPTPPDS